MTQWQIYRDAAMSLLAAITVYTLGEDHPATDPYAESLFSLYHAAMEWSNKEA